MTEYILHIGPHKTGTSAIQAYLSDHRDRLLAEGVDFPLFGRRPQGSQAHRYFAAYFRKPDSLSLPEGFASRMQTGFTSAPLCILSAEAFYLGSQPDVINRIATSLAPVRKVLFYRRSPVSHIASLYKEAIKHQETRVFSDYAAAQTQAMSDDTAFAYYRFDDNLKAWAKLAPVDGVTFSKETDLIEGFFNACGLAHLFQANQTEARRINESYSNATSWCLRMLNQGLEEESLSPQKWRKAKKRIQTPQGQVIADSLNGDILYDEVDLTAFLSVFHRLNPSFDGLRDETHTSLRMPIASQFTLDDLVAKLSLFQPSQKDHAT